MATVLPFNKITIGGTLVAGPDDFIYGTGNLKLKGEDTAVTTADGKIHNYRSALSPEATVEVRGNKCAKSTGQTEKWPTAGGTIVLALASSLSDASPTEVASFSGIISAEYDGEQNKTTLTIKGDDTSY